MKTSQVQRAWEVAVLHGEASWLTDSTFASATCFAPPPPQTRHHAWDRIAVPTTLALGGDRKIYKRVSAKPRFDRRYKDVVLELDSQGFGARKRARIHTYARPYPGHVEFDTEDEEKNSGTQDLALAREEVSVAYRTIWNDNKNLRVLSHKRSTYDPVSLTWTPRKRHHTRWPINPPSKDAEMIADLQPLIKFELSPHQIDDTSLWVQEQQQETPQEEPQPVKKTNPRRRRDRRRTLRPSLGTILEESAEVLRIACQTPNAKTPSASLSPTKQRSVAADRVKTPTKVASSPMSKFTLTATPDAGHMQTSPATIDSPSRLPATTESPHSSTSVPVFDQPVGEVEAEPEHESKRRISLDNARRSDRRSSTVVLKRIRNWTANTCHPPNRRHSDVAQLLQPSRGSHRRHTLDVDVGRNPDIFAQPLPQSGQPATHDDKSSFDAKFQEFQRRKPSSVREVDLSEEIDEDVVNMYLNPESAADAQGTDFSEPVASSPKKYTPLKDIPWDDFKLFPDVKIVSPSRDVVGTVVGDAPPSNQQADEDPEDTLPMVNLSVDLSAVSDEESTSPSDQEDDTPPMISIDLSDVSIEADGIIITEPTVHVLHDDTLEVTAVNETTTMDGDKDSADDDSALALLHSFVRRAQTSKQSSNIQDTASTTIARKRLSATSDTGSPMAKAEEGSTETPPSPRKPLEARDSNRSPSPKKRKLGRMADGEGDVPILKKSGGRLAKPDFEDLEPSQPRKRRKRMESDTDDIFNPEMDLGQNLTQKSRGGANIARRSSRIATTKSSKTIPVRFPGSSGMLTQDGDMPAVSTAGVTTAMIQRKMDKDLATETRTNTRRNKAGSVPVPVALISLAQQPASESPVCEVLSSGRTRPGRRKSVRWDPVLARVQGEEDEVSSPATSSPEGAEAAVVGKGDEDDDTMPSPPQMRHIEAPSSRPERQPTVVAPVAPEPEKKSKMPTRRSTRASTTSSRLPTARSAAPSPTPTVVASTPRKSSLPAPSRVAVPNKVGRPPGSTKSSGGGASVVGRLGTPAPKRRGTRRV